MEEDDAKRAAADVYAMLAGFNSYLAMWQGSYILNQSDKYRQAVSEYAFVVYERYCPIDLDRLPRAERDRLKYAFNLLACVLETCEIVITESGWFCSTTIPPPVNDPKVMLLRALVGDGTPLSPPPERLALRRERHAFDQRQAGAPHKAIGKAIKDDVGGPAVGEAEVRRLAKNHADRHGCTLKPLKRGRKKGGGNS